VANFQTFKDLSVTFKPHPITGDLITVKDEASIKQSIVNLLLTNKGERFFAPDVGSSISNLLFEPLDYGTASLLQSEIKTTLERYEPRIQIISIIATPNYDDNGFEVELVFEVIGRDDIPLNVNFFLERTR
jgi:phage baseplate assembly protein W